MKRGVTAALTLLSCLSLTSPARADSQKSLGVGLGALYSFSTFAGDGKGIPDAKMNSIAPLADANLLFHRTAITWGFGYRHRSAQTPAGNLAYDGGVFLLGYYSNEDHEAKFGWHALGGLGVGSLTGIDSKYQAVGNRVSVEFGAGLDVVLRKDEKNLHRRPAADVLSLDLRFDGFGGYVQPKNYTRDTKVRSLSAGGPSLALTFTHYFAWK